MRVHVVAPYSSFAMVKLIDPVFNMPAWITPSISDAPDWTADLNYFIPWLGMAQACEGRSPRGRSIALYTHTNPGAEQQLRWTADNCERVITMSHQGAHEVRATGTTTPIEVIYPGVRATNHTGFYPRKRNVLIVGAEQPNGRKNSGLLVDLAWRFPVTFCHFTIVGTGWGSTVTQLTNLGVSVEYHERLTDEDLAIQYRLADALLVTGFREGGPLTLIEALATGIPVITPGYGLAADLARHTDLYLYNDVESLYVQLQRLWRPVVDRMDVVRHFTLQRAVDDHIRLFQELFQISVKSRYDHVVNAVTHYTEPFHFMEIGVHRGDTAKRVIDTAIANGTTIHYHGYDLFRELTDEEMTTERSKQPATMEEVRAKLTTVGAHINLYPGDTRHTLAAPYTGGPMDLIFLDGGHSWATIERDWINLQKYIGPLTTILLDDYYTDSPGEIGCQKLIDGLDRAKWSVDIFLPTEIWGDLKINMVKVQRRVALDRPYQLQLV